MAHRKSKRNKVEQISISLPCEVLMKVDECARRENRSRSNYIHNILSKVMEQEAKRGGACEY